MLRLTSYIIMLIFIIREGKTQTCTIPFPSSTSCCTVPVLFTNGDLESSTTNVFNDNLNGYPASYLQSASNGNIGVGNTALPTGWGIADAQSTPFNGKSNYLGVFYTNTPTNKFIWMRGYGQCLAKAGLTVNLQPCRRYRVCVQAAGWSPTILNNTPYLPDGQVVAHIDVVLGRPDGSSSNYSHTQTLTAVTDICTIQWQQISYEFETPSDLNVTGALTAIALSVDEDSDGIIYDNFQLCDLGLSSSSASIVTQPTGFTECIGGTQQLNVTATNVTGYQWQSSPDSVNWTNIIGATTATYTPPSPSPSSWWYRVAVSGGSCNAVLSNAVKVIIVNDPSVFVTATAPSVCTGSSTTLTANINYGTGTTTYQWQTSTDSLNFSNISGANNSTYTTPNLTASTYYRVLVSQTGNGCGSAAAAAVKITVDLTSIGGTLSPANETICGSDNSIITLSGHRGTVLKWEHQRSTFDWYLWSTTSSTTAPNNCCWNNGPWYIRVIVKNGTCPEDTSSTATIINAAPMTITTFGTTTVCTGGSSTLTATTNGGGGTCTIQWQSSPDNLSFTNIVGATGTTYTTPALTNTTYYRAVYTCTGVGCGSTVSNGQTVNVVADPIISISTNTTGVCIGGNTILNATVSGGTGNCSIQWQSYNGSTWNNISGATGNSYTTPALSAQTRYRAQISCSGNGCCN